MDVGYHQLRDAQLSYGPRHRVYPIDLWSWVYRDVQLSYGPRRRAVFRFQVFQYTVFRLSVYSFQKSDFNKQFLENRFHKQFPKNSSFIRDS